MVLQRAHGKSSRRRRSSLVGIVMCSAAGSVVLTIIAAAAALAQSESRPLPLLDAIVYVLDWPNLMLFGRGFYMANARTFLINAAGWSLVGIGVGVLRISRASVTRDEPKSLALPT